MRLLLNFSTSESLKSEIFNKYYIQSFIYSTLINTDFENIHNKKGFKFFTFSDYFPSGDMDKNQIKSIIISSPSEEFIKTIKDRLEERGFFYLHNKRLEIESLKTYFINYIPKSVETGSPIVLYYDGKRNKYFSFRDKGTISFFLRRLKENAIKKYMTYYSIDEFDINEMLFDSLMFKKEVAVKVTKNGIDFIIIGSLWYYLNKIYINERYKRFYKFILDAGLGEKNSLGFGFLNPKKVEKV